MSEQDTYYIDLITRYLSGEYTGEDLRLLSEWLKVDKEHEATFRQYLKTWQMLEQQKNQSISIDQEWETLQARIGLTEASHPSPLRVVKPASNTNGFGSQVQRMWKIAAVIVILLVSSFLIYHYVAKPQDIIVTAQSGNIEQVLPDGSVVSLHVGSQLIYPEQFASNIRKVELKGEAYFKVAHNPLQPFIVSSNDARVEVLGTQFNVNTHTATGAMEVVLTVGKVSVYYSEKPKENVLLLPGEKAELSVEGMQIHKTANTDLNYMAWKTKILVFDNETLSDVVNTLQSVYQTTIKLTDPALSGCKFTATFHEQSLQSVLQVIQQTLDLQVKQSGNIIEMSGKPSR